MRNFIGVYLVAVISSFTSVVVWETVKPHMAPSPAATAIPACK